MKLVEQPRWEIRIVRVDAGAMRGQPYRDEAMDKCGRKLKRAFGILRRNGRVARQVIESRFEIGGRGGGQDR